MWCWKYSCVLKYFSFHIPIFGGQSFDNAVGYYKKKRDGGWVRSSNIDRSQRIRGSAIQLLLPSHTSRSIVMENTKMMLYLPSPIGEVPFPFSKWKHSPALFLLKYLIVSGVYYKRFFIIYMKTLSIGYIEKGGEVKAPIIFDAIYLNKVFDELAILSFPG